MPKMKREFRVEFQKVVSKTYFVEVEVDENDDSDDAYQLAEAKAWDRWFSADPKLSTPDETYDEGEWNVTVEVA